MRRTAIFAHYDKDNKIEDYVIYYLRGLSQVADKIVFVSDCDLEAEELKKISELTINNIVGRHGEYDFGSYKRGFMYCSTQRLLLDCEELIFANDSCYAPLYPVEEMFSEMRDENIDFWGATENLFGLKRLVDEKGRDKVAAIYRPHIQSYFVVLRTGVFESEPFKAFIENIRQEDNKIDIIIKYELGLTSCLREAGFTYRAYARRYENSLNIHVELWRRLFRERLPFIKTSVLRLVNLESGVLPIGWEKEIGENSSYPVELIKLDLKKNKKHINFVTWIQVIRKWLISINMRKNKITICGKIFQIKKK